MVVAGSERREGESAKRGFGMREEEMGESEKARKVE